MAMMSSRPPLTPLPIALARLVAALPPLAPRELPVSEALDLVAAETVTARCPVPARALAARRGVAVSSSDLVGASPNAPALLQARPPLVLPGDPLPEGADAVLPEDAVEGFGGLHEIGQSAYPGEGIVVAGADMPEGAVVLRAGETVTAAALLALRLDGRETLKVWQPLVLIEGAGAAVPVTEWLSETLREAGCRLGAAGDAQLRIRLTRDVEAAIAEPGGGALFSGVAIAPGMETALLETASGPVIVMGPRPDAAICVLHALLLPAIASWTGRRLRPVSRVLTDKLVSPVGVAGVALLGAGSDGYKPLANGQISLPALMAADAVAIIGPESEGAAAGTLLPATPLLNPFEPL
jgi:molybdopterin molybdotransferase